MTRHFTDWQQALTLCFEEEVGGEAYFAALALRYPPPARRALNLFAQIEAVTYSALQPLMTRAGFRSRPAEALARDGAQEASGRPLLDWADFLRAIVRDYPAYMPEFEQTMALAPPQMRGALQILIDHEQALIDFAQASLDHNPKAMAFLTRFLDRYAPQGASRASVISTSV